MLAELVATRLSVFAVAVGARVRRVTLALPTKVAMVALVLLLAPLPDQHTLVVVAEPLTVEQQERADLAAVAMLLIRQIRGLLELQTQAAAAVAH